MHELLCGVGCVAASSLLAAAWDAGNHVAVGFAVVGIAAFVIDYLQG